MGVRILILLFLTTAMSVQGAVRLKKGDTLPLVTDTIKNGGTVLIEATAAPIKMRQKQGESLTAWGVRWTDKNDNPCEFLLKWHNSDLGSFNDRRSMIISISRGAETLMTDTVTEGVNLFKGPNSLKLSLSPQGDARWTVGGTALGAAGSLAMGEPRDDSFALFAQGSDLNVFSSRTSIIEDKREYAVTPFTDASFFPSGENNLFNPAGVWEFLDRDNDARWARLGGRYVLGVRPCDNNTGEWDIIYLEGAVTNAGRWKPGMWKGRLSSTPFNNHFNLMWVDAAFEVMSRTDECSATLSDDGSIITLSFPLDRSTIRFYRKQ